MLRAILSVMLAGASRRRAGLSHRRSAAPSGRRADGARDERAADLADAVELGRLPATRLTQRQTVSSGASAASERSTVWSGVLLRDVLTHAGFGTGNDRARDRHRRSRGHRWLPRRLQLGRAFNSGIGEQTLVIVAQDDRPLDAVAGPLALRSLADVRPGPRHVRNLCALLVRR